MPLIGTLDSARTQVVTESLLESIVKTTSKVAITDITGVPTVDTVVAQNLLKTITAAPLGADCIIRRVRPQIAQTIVHLGISLQDITAKATMSDAFAVAKQQSGLNFLRPSTWLDYKAKTCGSLLRVEKLGRDFDLIPRGKTIRVTNGSLTFRNLPPKSQTGIKPI